MKLNEIRTLVAVAEARSIQEAANRLHLTQSAVSRLIQRLESEIGAVLFDRQTKPLALTRDGCIAVDHARRVLKAVEAMSDAFTATDDPVGLVRLGVSHVLVRLAGGEPLDTLRTAFPRLTLRIHTDWSLALLSQLAEGTLDAALILDHGRAVAADTPPGDLGGRLIAREDVRVFGTPELIARHGHSLEAMNAVGWVLQPDGCGYRTALQQALDAAGGQPLNAAVEAYDQDLLVSLAARGVGFGVGPLRLLSGTVAAERLVPVEVEGFRQTIAVWLVRARHSGRLDRVFDLLERHLMRTLRPLPFVPEHSAAE